MSKTLLLSPARLKAVSEAHSNVDEKIIQRAIETAQDLELEMILGTTLMEALKTKVAANVWTGGNAIYKVLLDQHVEPALIWYTMVELLDLITYKVGNKGVMKRVAEEAQPISNSEKAELIRRYKSKAEIYGDRLVRYLITNASSFTEYTNAERTLDKEIPRGRGWSAGFYFEDDNPRTNNDRPTDRPKDI